MPYAGGPWSLLWACECRVACWGSTRGTLWSAVWLSGGVLRAKFKPPLLTWCRTAWSKEGTGSAWLEPSMYGGGSY